MKHQAINLVQFRSLSARLKLPLWQTVGVLETPWLFTIHNARDGSLEAFTAAEIAVWMGFEGDADGLAPTVVSLVVHDDTIEFQSANSEPNMWIWPQLVSHTEFAGIPNVESAANSLAELLATDDADLRRCQDAMQYGKTRRPIIHICVHLRHLRPTSFPHLPHAHPRH